jgi:hypothetical protein
MIKRNIGGRVRRLVVRKLTSWDVGKLGKDEDPEAQCNEVYELNKLNKHNKACTTSNTQQTTNTRQRPTSN